MVDVLNDEHKVHYFWDEILSKIPINFNFFFPPLLLFLYLLLFVSGFGDSFPFIIEESLNCFCCFGVTVPLLA